MNKTCKQCGEEFEITNEDLEFYRMMEVPEPTFCYLCRAQRRFANRNERFLYHRKCDLTGKEIVSAFSPDKPFPVYQIDAWWSDKWDSTDFARDFDFNRSFFEQFFELRNCVPRLALQQQKPMINSDYCNCASQNKNCYLVFSTNRCEDCCYGSWVNDCRDCVDNKTISKCELCYDCFNCYDSYGLKYCRDCSNCKTSYFLRDCSSCIDCFACSNLHNKQYYVFNKQKTREEYEKFMKSINMGSRKVVSDGKKKAADILGDLIVKEYHGNNAENSLGDYIFDCKNAYCSFECTDSEDIRYCFYVEKVKNVMDYNHWGVNCERMYECQACGYDCFNLRFCNLCWTSCSDLTYCDHCFSSRNCFGCVGLRKKEYCIFNKQYGKEDYFDLKGRIIEHMKTPQGGAEWGEFFPVAQSCFAFNETIGNEEFPLSREKVLERGWQWKEKDLKEYKPQKYVLPDDIKDVSDSIIDELLSCVNCGKNFKIIQPEFKFYKRQNIPVPDKCPDCRHLERLKFRNGRRIFGIKCQNCGKAIKSTYNGKGEERVYCEECYLKEVY